MAASDHLGKQFFDLMTIHRGVSYGGKLQQPLGMHWSEEHGLDTLDSSFKRQKGAAMFVGDPGFDNAVHPGEKGTIIHARPAVGATTWDKRGDKKFLKEAGVLGALSQKDLEFDSTRVEREAEVPVRPGSKVLVTGVTRVRNTGNKLKTRSINYKQPREMKA
jgi:hypothetical protein